MKIIKYLFASIIILSAVSCNSESDKLIGLWQITGAQTIETYQKGKKAGEEFSRMDTELQAEYGGGNLELRKDKTATLKTNQQSNAFTWKMNKEALELYKEGKSSPDIIFFPSVDGADLMYMKGIDVISAKMVFPADNTAIIVALKK